MANFKTAGRRNAGYFFGALLVTVIAGSCGGGTGGPGPEGDGQGLMLVSFIQGALDTVALNERLVFVFSEPLDASTITPASIQIREGPSFGRSIPGRYIVQGEQVIFEPALPTHCDLSDGGLQPATTYRVQVIGFPEQFTIRNTRGQPLSRTESFSFSTRVEEGGFLDEVPGEMPFVASVSPLNGSEAVRVGPENQVVIRLSENLDPCSISEDTVRFHIYEEGTRDTFTPSLGGGLSGFDLAGRTSDQDPSLFSWGADGTNALLPPQRVRATFTLQQDFGSTRLLITPEAGQFPENALLVVELTFGMEDFGGNPLTPFGFSFTTENLTEQTVARTIDNEGETPYLDEGTTADVNTARAPGAVQAFLAFAGDGDNGFDLLRPSLPQSDPECAFDRQANDGKDDVFDPSTDVLLDTGASPNVCLNGTDESTAVVWEFNSLRIRSGVTVRIVGVNPAILLVKGDVLVEPGGVLRVRGDGLGGSPNGDGANGAAQNSGNTNIAVRGGVGVAGGGDGGDGVRANQAAVYGEDGYAGFGSPDHDPLMDPEGEGLGGLGAGLAGQPAGTSVNPPNPWNGSSAGGGGGGHRSAGATGSRLSGAQFMLQLQPRSDGGASYGDVRLPTPEAGSGGGSAGFMNGRPWSTTTAWQATGGGGGAGGGFIDITSSTSISILGTIDAAGGRGGDGNGWLGRSHSGGGGGGAGGAVRLLTPQDIILGNTTTITAAGGQGGAGNQTNPTNDGGAGANGRIVMEDGDSVITGLAAASVTPGAPADGLFTGPFDSNRFKGGGRTPRALTDLFWVGRLDPLYEAPVQDYAGRTDFAAGVPKLGSPGIGQTAILVEARAFEMRADGTPDLGSATDYFTVGHFTDSGVVTQPTWHLDQPSVPLPKDNAGFGIHNLSGREFLQVRFTFFLPESVGAFDPGPFVDRWDIRFRADR